MIDAVTSNYGLRQLVQDAAHTLNSFSSCTDLIFISQPNLVVESEVHLIAIIRLSFQNLICLFYIHHLTTELFGFMKKPTMNLSEDL